MEGQDHDLDLEKQYRYARSLVGDDYRDLVHHCYLRFVRFTEGKTIANPNSYFYQIMIRQLRDRDEFMRLYKIKSIPYEDITHAIELSDKNNVYDAEKIHQILEDLTNEGHREEVEVFKWIATHKNKSELSRQSGILRRDIRKICNFIKIETRKRYGAHSY